MDLTRYFSTRRKELSEHHHNSSHDSTQLRNDGKRYLPLLASPINSDVRKVLSGTFSDLEKTNTASTAGSSSNPPIFAGSGRTSRGNVIIFKQHHEASTIELFYDLFFVANLGTNLDRILFPN